MMHKDFYVLGSFCGFICVVICVDHSSGHSLLRVTRQASDYDKRAETILKETPLVDGWVLTDAGPLQQRVAKFLWLTKDYSSMF